MPANRFKSNMRLYWKGFLALFLLAGSAFAQVPLLERGISLEEVQVKPREVKVWEQRGKAPLLPIMSHYIRVCDSAGKQHPPLVSLNKIEAFSERTIQINSVETKIASFENDSFDVFFFVMQIAGKDTLIQRKLIVGKDVKKRRYTLNFSPGELTLLPQTAYWGLEVVPRKVSTHCEYYLYKANACKFFYYYHPVSRLFYPVPNYGATFNWKVRYVEL